MKFTEVGLNRLEEKILREAIDLHGGAIFLSPKGISQAVADNPVDIIRRISTGEYLRCPEYLEIADSELRLTHKTWYAPDYIIGLPFPSATEDYCRFLISEYQRSGNLANVIFCPGNYVKGLCGRGEVIEEFLENTVPAKAIEDGVQNFILEDHLTSKSGDFELYMYLKYSIYKSTEGKFCIDLSGSSRVELYESIPRFHYIDAKAYDCEVAMSSSDQKNLLEKFNDIFLEPAMSISDFFSGKLSWLFGKCCHSAVEEEFYFDLLKDEFGFQDFSELVAKALLGGQWTSTWLCCGQHAYPNQRIGSRTKSYESMKLRIFNEKKRREEQKKDWQKRLENARILKMISRDLQFERNGGGQFVCTDRPHRNKKKYYRKDKSWKNNLGL